MRIPHPPECRHRMQRLMVKVYGPLEFSLDEKLAFAKGRKYTWQEQLEEYRLRKINKLFNRITSKDISPHIHLASIRWRRPDECANEILKVERVCVFSGTKSRERSPGSVFCE